MIINRLYRYNLTYFLFPGSHKHFIRYQNILFIRINKKSISDYPWNYTAMERRNISFRLQSRKAQYIMKGGKVGRKTGYCKPKEEKGVLFVDVYLERGVISLFLFIFHSFLLPVVVLIMYSNINSASHNSLKITSRTIILRDSIFFYRKNAQSFDKVCIFAPK